MEQIQQPIDIQKINNLELLEIYIQQRDLLAQAQQNVIAIQAELARRKEQAKASPSMEAQ